MLIFQEKLALPPPSLRAENIVQEKRTGVGERERERQRERQREEGWE